MSDMSNQYGYGLDPVLQSAILGLATKDKTGQANRLQDLVSILFDPKFAAYGGNFDPAYTQPQTFTPTYGPYLSSSLNSAVPIWRQAATSIINGDVDPTSAVLEVANALGVTKDLPNEQGLSFDAIEQQVLKMFDEAGTAMKEEKDFYAAQQAAYGETVFGKAGLPNPQAQYTISEDLATTDPMSYVALPYSQEYQDLMSQYNEQMRNAGTLRKSADAVSNREMSALYEQMWKDYENQRSKEAPVKEEKVVKESGPTAEAFAAANGLDPEQVKKAMRSALSDVTLQYEIPVSDVMKYDKSREMYTARLRQYLEKNTGFTAENYDRMSPEAKAFFDAPYSELASRTGDAAMPTRWEPPAKDKKKAEMTQQEVDARRGIAMSYEAQTQAKAAPAVSEATKRLRIEEGKAQTTQRDANMQRMIDLYLANLARRTPTSDALKARTYSALGM